MKTYKKVLGTIGLIGLVAGSAFLGGCSAEPEEPVCVQNITEADVKAAFQNGVDSVEVPVCPEVEVCEQEITQADVDAAVAEARAEEATIKAELLASMEDRGLIADADEVEAELDAEDAAIEMALDKLNDKEELFDMLEEAGIVVDEDEVRVIKVYSDFEDITIVDSDFDNEEYEFNIELKVEDTEDEVKKYVIANITIEDGETTLNSVSEK